MDKHDQEIWRAIEGYKSGFQPNTEAAWQKMRTRMAAADETAAPATAPVRSLHRFWLRAAAAIVLGIGAFWAWQASTASEMAYATGPGESLSVELPDGTQAWLNQNSSLSFKSEQGARRAIFSGEAFFQVAKDKERPFLIASKGTETRVLGTAFNLRAYPEEPTVEVEVAEGKVRLSEPENGKAVELNPFEKGTYNANEGVLGKKQAPNLNGLAWRTGKLSFRQTPLSTVLTDLERFYGVDILLTDAALSHCTLTSTFEGEALEEVFLVLSTIFEFKLDSSAGQYVLKGGRCNGKELTQ